MTSEFLNAVKICIPVFWHIRKCKHEGG